MRHQPLNFAQSGGSTDISSLLFEKRPSVIVDESGGSFLLSAGHPGAHVLAIQWEPSGPRQTLWRKGGPIARLALPPPSRRFPEKLNRSRRNAYGYQNLSQDGVMRLRKSSIWMMQVVTLHNPTRRVTVGARIRTVPCLTVRGAAGNRD